MLIVLIFLRINISSQPMVEATKEVDWLHCVNHSVTGTQFALFSMYYATEKGNNHLYHVFKR